MKCPNCPAEVGDDALECPQCGVIFAKWKKVKESAPEKAVSAPAREPEDLVDINIPAAAAAVVAFFIMLQFRNWLPITEGYASFTSVFFILSQVDLVFHEAGHWIFGVLGSRFLTSAGGTLMQLIMPASCLFHFWRQKSCVGVLAVVWWLGYNLVSIAYYAADAKMQVIILITGKSGSEGGGHDWGLMLGTLGLKENCVGVGQLFFFLGCWAMAFSPIYGLIWAWKKWKKPVPLS